MNMSDGWSEAKPTNSVAIYATAGGMSIPPNMLVSPSLPLIPAFASMSCQFV